MTRARAHQLETLAGAVAALVRRVEVLERERRDLAEQVRTLRGSLHLLWMRCEALERARFVPAVRAPDPEPAPPAFMTVSEAAKALGVTDQSIYRSLSDGRLSGLGEPWRGRTKWLVFRTSINRAAGRGVESRGMKLAPSRVQSVKENP